MSQHYIADTRYVQVFILLTTPKKCYSKSSSQNYLPQPFENYRKNDLKLNKMSSYAKKKQSLLNLCSNNKSWHYQKWRHSKLIFSVLSCLNLAHANKIENSLSSHAPPWPCRTETFYCCLSPSSLWERQFFLRQTQRLY